MATTGNPGYLSPVDFRIQQTPDDKLPDNVQPAFTEVYAAIQQLIYALTTYCGIGPQPKDFWVLLATQAAEQGLLSANLNRLYVTFSETVVSGALVNLYDAGTTYAGARNANATNNTRWCQAFCTTGGNAGDVGEVIVKAGVVPIAGLTRGARYWLSTVNGLISAVAPVAAGNVEQYVGWALTTGLLVFDPVGNWIQH